MEPDQPERRRIVVDGSNIATEGRTLPSLAQLDEAIRAFLDEYKGFATADVTVVVDASFGHRIDPSEVPAFEQAIEHGEMVTPPAGAVGRGDGFILRIAEKSGALVLSNDSFQEFHAERPWLFEPGRLIGGKPVPGVGWIFTPRTPVRGAVSRSVTSKSKRESKGAEDGGGVAVEDQDVPKATRTRKSAKSAKSAPASPAPPVKATRSTRSTRSIEAAAGGVDTHDADDTYDDGPRPQVASRAMKATKATKAAAKVTKAAAKATKVTKATKAPATAKATKATKATKVTKAAKGTRATKAATTTTASRGVKATKAAGPAQSAEPADRVDVPADDGAEPSGGRPSAPSGEALNDALTFLTFVADHPVGSSFDGTVVSFTSHGAHIDVGGMLCHVPLRGLAVPPPNKARQVLTKGETRPFVLVSLDAPRRRAELVLPELAE